MDEGTERVPFVVAGEDGRTVVEPEDAQLTLAEGAGTESAAEWLAGKADVDPASLDSLDASWLQPGAAASVAAEGGAWIVGDSEASFDLSEVGVGERAAPREFAATVAARTDVHRPEFDDLEARWVTADDPRPDDVPAPHDGPGTPTYPDRFVEAATDADSEEYDDLEFEWLEPGATVTVTGRVEPTHEYGAGTVVRSGSWARGFPLAVVDDGADAAERRTITEGLKGTLLGVILIAVGGGFVWFATGALAEAGVL